MPCDALRTGRVGQLPVKLRKLTVKTRHLSYVYVRCGSETAIHQRPSGDIWQGLWEPPVFEDEALPAFRGELTLLQSDVKHVLTHRILLSDFYLLETNEKPSLPDDYRWIAETDLNSYALPRLVERLLETITKRGCID